MTNLGIATIAHFTVSDAVVYSLTGFVVVLATLALLWLVTAIVGQIVKATGLDKVATPETTAKPATTAIPPETIAVVTAAVSFATGGQAKIKDIRKL